ncbi:MAG TPA: hypothetical protein VM431_06665 [Phycisphaerae bacterium]|nr:hypothetical protein [Phycisphaerae bacterium]
MSLCSVVVLADLVKALDLAYPTETFYSPDPVSVFEAYPESVGDNRILKGETWAEVREGLLAILHAGPGEPTRCMWTKMQWPGFIVDLIVRFKEDAKEEKKRARMFYSFPAFVHAFDRRFKTLREWATERARKAGDGKADGEHLALDYADGGIVDISCPPRPPAGAPESERLEWLVRRCRTLQACFSGPAGRYPNCEARDWLAAAYSAACDWLPPATVGKCEHLVTFDAADRFPSAAREELERLEVAATTCLLELHQAGRAGRAAAVVPQQGLVSSTRKKKRLRMKREVAEPLILDHLLRRPHDTVEDVVKAIGCSVGVVAESPPWRANQERLKRAKREGKDPKAVKLNVKALTEAGGHRRSQGHESKRQQEARDEEIDQRERELFWRIGEYEKAHPQATPKEIALAVNCTAGDVERRQALLDRLAAEQAGSAREDAGGQLPDAVEPGVDLSKPKQWFRKQP